MLLYKTSGTDPVDDIVKVKWSGTQADARRDRNDMAASHFSNVWTDAINIPTDKPGLLDWLNANPELEEEIVWTGLRAL